MMIKPPRYLLPIDEGMDELLDRLLDEWITDVGTVEGLTVADLTNLVDISRVHSCYTCFWSSYGTCVYPGKREYMIPDECPLPGMDLSMEEIFGNESELLC